MNHLSLIMLSISIFCSNYITWVKKGMLYGNLRGQQRKAPLFQLNDLYKSNMKLYLMESFYQSVADLLPVEEHEFVQAMHLRI